MNVSGLDDALDRLAAVPPRDFTKERSALAARLTKLGQAGAAAKVKAQRAPTIPVWAVNRLARDNPKLVERIVAAAERVGAAQLGRDTTLPLGAAMSAYREATDAALGRLDDLLAGAEVTASHQVRLRIQNTLMAAAADPKTRQALQAGLLEQEMTASGFDLFSGAAPAPRTASSRPDREPKRNAAKADAAPGPSPREREATAREERARRRIEAKASADRKKAAEAERLRPLQDAVAEAGRMLAQAKEEARRAAAAVGAASRRKRDADQALRAARRRHGRSGLGAGPAAPPSA